MIRGFNNPKRLQQDKDFENIRQEAGFQAIVAELKRRQTFWDSPALKTPYQPNLSDAEKLAGLARIWSEAKHNFVWFANVPDLDWDKAYIDTIPRVLKTTSTLDYYRELRRLYALLRDGHTGVNMPIDLLDQIFSRPAIRTRLVEDKVLVIQVLDTDVRIAVGTEVLEVDEVPVRQYAIERIARNSRPPRHKI
jgi:hypothetical protein